MKHSALFSFALLTVLALSLPVFTQSTSRLDSFKKEAVADVEQMKDFSAQMVDQVFSYGELGFQEFETSRYLIGTLKSFSGRRLTLFETVTSKTWTSVSSCMLVTISMSATGQPMAAGLSPSNTRFVAKRRMPLQLRGAAEARWMQSS